MFPYPVTYIMRIQKLHLPFPREVEFQHIYSPAGGAGGFTAWVQPVSAPHGQLRLFRRKDLQMEEEPQKPLSCSLPTPFCSLRSNSKLWGRATKQQSPVTWSWLWIILTAFYRGPPIPRCIITLPIPIPDVWQFPSDLHFSCGNSCMKDWSSKSSRFSPVSLP